MSKKRVRLVHTSDTHLGVDWQPELAEAAFRAVLAGARTLEADALLVVGDVFDHARVPDRVLDFFVSQVAQAGFPVIVLPGNHDLYHRDSLYRRHPFAKAPGNLLLFRQPKGQVISLPGLTVDFWGRAMTEHTPDFRPLLGMPPAAAGRWLVALAHGHYHFDYDNVRRSSPVYPAEVAAAPCHYLALGHWERFADVSQGDTIACYSGSPLGAARDDETVTVNVVALEPGLTERVSVRQVALPLAMPAAADAAQSLRQADGKGGGNR